MRLQAILLCLFTFAISCMPRRTDGQTAGLVSSEDSFAGSGRLVAMRENTSSEACWSGGDVPVEKVRELTGTKSSDATVLSDFLSAPKLLNLHALSDTQIATALNASAQWVGILKTQSKGLVIDGITLGNFCIYALSENWKSLAAKGPSCHLAQLSLGADGNVVAGAVDGAQQFDSLNLDQRWDLLKEFNAKTASASAGTNTCRAYGAN